MNKHTPAPWLIDSQSKFQLCITNSDGRKAICFLPIMLEETEANIKLIAAAPELLEALQNVRQNMTAHIPEKVFDLVDNAIKKATE
jgi:hypothetical protein